jgi:hypothetical protein
MSNPRRNMRPIVLYVPAGSRSTARIPRGSALVFQSRCGAREIEVYFKGAPTGRRGLRTLADRALSASGRLLERAVFGGCLLVPPAALTVVGTVNFPAGTIALTGPHSARAVANWLGTPYLDPAELRESGSAVADHEELAAAAWTSALEPELLHALLRRGGIKRDGQAWRAPNGRQTTTVDDALIWALERIAKGADRGRRRDDTRQNRVGPAAIGNGSCRQLLLGCVA